MTTQTDENTHRPLQNNNGHNQGHQTPKLSPRTSLSTWLHVPPAQKLQPDSPWIHTPTILPPKETQVEPGPDPEENTTSKKRARVDSGVSLSSISSLFKIPHHKGSKDSTKSRSSTITSKSSIASTGNETVSSTSTAPSLPEGPPEPAEPAVPPKKVKFAVETETPREKFNRESQARHKVIDDQIRAHREKERARNQRAEELLTVSRQYERVSESKLRKAVRENEIFDRGTRGERFKRWVRGLLSMGKKRNGPEKADHSRSSS